MDIRLIKQTEARTPNMRRRRGTGQKVQLGRPGCLAYGLQSVKLLRCKRGNYRANGEDHLACSASCSFPISLSGGLGGRDRSGAQLPGRGRSAGRCPRTASGFFLQRDPLFPKASEVPGIAVPVLCAKPKLGLQPLRGIGPALRHCIAPSQGLLRTVSPGSSLHVSKRA